MNVNGVVPKLLFLISVYEFPLLLQYYLFNYLYMNYTMEVAPLRMCALSWQYPGPKRYSLNTEIITYTCICDHLIV